MRFGPDDPEADPRLPEVYDAENQWGRDDEFFVGLAERRPHSRIVDLGCGTGRLAIALAGAGHIVTAVDPNPAMLACARSKPGADRVTWIEGTSACLGSESFDLALMTSHVAQVFTGDAEWRSVITDLRRALVPAGALCFDSRDPRARAWERWTKETTRTVIELSDSRRVETWVDVADVDDDVVTFAWVNVFPDGDTVEGTTSLRFRSEERLRSSLASAGFDVRDIFGGWDGEPIGPDTAELIVVAVAT